MCLLTLARYSQLPPHLAAGSNDLRIYRETGEAILRGELPYRDFFIEYPPGSLPAFVPPALFSQGTSGYATLFASEMSLVLIVSLVLVALTARNLGGKWAWFAPALSFAAGVVLLYPVALGRYDPVVTLSLALAAFLASSGGRSRLLAAYASLGFGSAAKLVPALATLPLALLGGALRVRKALSGFAVFFATLGLFLVPAYLLGGGRFLESFSYHADRGLQLESLAAAGLLRLGWVDEVVFRFGAWEVEGLGAETLSALSMPVTAALLAVTAAVMYRDHRQHGFEAGRFARYAAALILAFMLGSKVLSPQYLLWLLPLVPLAAGGLWGVGVSGVLLSACWTTTQVFPHNYDALVGLQPAAIDLLVVRNLLLVLLWGLLLVLPRTSSPGAGPGDGA